MAFLGDELWVVNTLFSCLATIQPGYSFVPRWKPKFISNCHVPGRPLPSKWLGHRRRPTRSTSTAMAENRYAPAAWRAAKDKTGLLIDGRLAAGSCCRGLAMPHSPPRLTRARSGRSISGRGQVWSGSIRRAGRWEVVTTFPGYNPRTGPSPVRWPSWVCRGSARPSVFGRPADRRAARAAQVRRGAWSTCASGQQVAAFQFRGRGGRDFRRPNCYPASAAPRAPAVRCPKTNTTDRNLGRATPPRPASNPIPPAISEQLKTP